MNTETDSNGFTFKKNGDILSGMMDTIMLKNSKVNDFTVGSVLRTLLESESLELEMLYYLQLENLNHAIDESVLQAFGFAPIDYVHAFGDVTIYFADALTKDLYIPKGTRFGCSNKAYNQEFVTKTAYKVAKGAGSCSITVYCDNDNNIGSYGNVPKNLIDTTPDMSGIAYITNPQDFLTGNDGETINQTKARFRAMIQSLSRGTRQSLEYATLAVEGVTGCSIYESTYGAVIIYAHDANGNLSQELIEKIEANVAQYKPAGIQVIIRPIHVTNVNLKVGVNIKYADYQNTTYLDLIKQSVVNYLNQFQAGDTLYMSQTEDTIMNANNSMIRDVAIDYEVVPDSSLRDDAFIPDDTIANVAGVVVSQKYLQDPDIVTNDTYGWPSPHDPLKDVTISWKDADTEEENNETILEPIKLYANYKCASNELIRCGEVTMYLLTGDENIPVAHITLADDSISLMTGKTYQIQASVFPQNATNKLLTYTSSNANIVYVSSTGQVKSMTAGDARIIVSSLDGSQITAILQVESKGLPVQGVNLLSDTITSGEVTGTVSQNQFIHDYAFYLGNLNIWVQLGSKYAISFDWKASDGAAGNIHPEFNGNPLTHLIDNENTAIDISKYNNGHCSAVFVADATMTDASSTAGGIKFVGNNISGTVTIYHVKFEQSSAPTEWTPAPSERK